MFVNGKECGLPLTPLDREAKRIARYDLATYECGLGHRTYFLLEPKRSRGSIPEEEGIQKRIDELTRKYVETRDPKIREEIYKLGRELEELERK